MLPEPLPILGYRRVSTEDQKDRGSSLEAQSDKIRAFAAALGHQLVDIVDDGGESAKSLDRPGIQSCLARISAGEIRGLLVANLDRLTRHVGDLVSLVEGYFLEPGGPVLLSASEPIETRTAVGRLQIYILATVSQYQREAGAERTAGVMARKKRVSERAGNLAFGTKLDPDDPRRSKQDRPIALVESPEDLAIVERIVSMRRDYGLSLRQIANVLNEEQIPSKRGVTKRSTGLWSKSTVAEILKRQVKHAKG